MQPIGGRRVGGRPMRRRPQTPVGGELYMGARINGVHTKRERAEKKAGWHRPKGGDVPSPSVGMPAVNPRLLIASGATSFAGLDVSPWPLRGSVMLTCSSALPRYPYRRIPPPLGQRGSTKNGVRKPRSPRLIAGRSCATSWVCQGEMKCPLRLLTDGRWLAYWEPGAGSPRSDEPTR